MKTVVCLGRAGDVINALPIARHLAGDGKCRFVVSAAFAPIFDRVSYVEPVPVKDDYSRLPEVMAKYPEAVVAQYYMHPDSSRTTDSYQKESWVRAGYGDKFGTLQTEFDRRDPVAENQLLDQSIPDKQKPYIIVAADGISSPYHRKTELLVAIDRRFSATHQVIDASRVKAGNVVDLIALIHGAAVLVTIDSLYLHLARCTQTPTVALIQDGFFGSVPPPSCVAVKRYHECKLSCEPVLDAITRTVHPREHTGAVHHLVQPFGNTERHGRAQATWRLVYAKGVLPCHITATPRTSQLIGCNRRLPFIKDMLRQAMARAGEKDIIIWTNSDVTLSEGMIGWARKVVGTFGAVSMRRNEPGHCGRDLFAFKVEWLHEHMQEMPDYICGASDFDLGLAAMIRMKRGIVTTLANLSIDFLPCDAPERLYCHEPHEGAWTTDPQSPSNAHNRKQFMVWAKKHAPRIKFSPGGIIA